MFNTSELDELFRILNSIKGFKLRQPQWSNTTLYVLPLHPYIPKMKNLDGGSTLISDILMQIVISPFSLEILRKLPSFVFFTTKSL